MIRPPALRAGPLLLLAGCAAAPVNQAPAPAPATTSCEASVPAPPPVASVTSAAPLCRERLEVFSSCGAQPEIVVGETPICAAVCVGEAASPAEGLADEADCRAPSRPSFPDCDAATIARSISIADFLEPTSPKPGATVLVRGRLGPGGVHDGRRPALLGLVSDRDYGGICLLAHLIPRAGEAPGRWLCSPFPGGGGTRPCCNEDPSRPLTGQEIVMRANVDKVRLGAPTILFGIVDLVPESLCVVRKHP